MIKRVSLNPQPEPGRDVFYLVSINNVYRINLPKQTFHAAVTFDFRWRPTAKELASLPEQALRRRSISWQPIFKPADKMYLLNALSDNLTRKSGEVSIRTIKEVGADLFFGQKFTVVGEFFNNFDLKAYPSDTQNLNIGFKTRSSNMTLVPMSFGDIDFFKVSEHVFSKTYFYSNAMVEQGVVGEGEETRGVSDYYYVWLTMKVTRNPLDFILRHSSWLLMFSFGTFGVYTISNENIGERMSYLVTIFVIFSAYSIVLSTELPEVPYYTHGDYLIICHTLFVFTATFLISMGSPEFWDFDEGVERLLACFLLALWIVYNTAWFARLYWLYKQAPKFARQPYTDSRDTSRMMTTGGVGGVLQKGKVACYGIRAIKAPGWEKPTSNNFSLLNIE